jgi:hypothetical protein
MTASRRQIVRPRHDAPVRGSGKRPGAATEQGGARDEPFAEELHSSGNATVAVTIRSGGGAGCVGLRNGGIQRKPP